MRCYFFSILLLIANSIYSQTENDFSKKGKFLVEANSTSLITFNNLGADDLGISFDIGYFISEEFAIKTIYNSNIFINYNQFGTISFHAIMVGGKYYLLGRIPLQITGGLTLQSRDDFVENTTNGIGRVTAGYAIKLAKNIFLEPSLSQNIVPGPDYLTFGFSFAMILGSKHS